MRRKVQTAVIGAGLMGHGIALTLARAGQNVAITDPMAEARASLPRRVAESLRLMGEEVIPAVREMATELDLPGPFEVDPATGKRLVAAPGPQQPSFGGSEDSALEIKV